MEGLEEISQLKVVLTADTQRFGEHMSFLRRGTCI
jgi:hypothetical protein